ncbi:unnamed protein product [Periconia digitata]|uniref:Uncharacterized protein n=1 Tax=Periconia digitata TaxID=1303443 RepID=A0A9W4UM86_9PLEO|nr:unnamed protein product [Periconia digitata]
MHGWVTCHFVYIDIDFIMRQNHDYYPLLNVEDSLQVDEKGLGVDWSDHTQIIPTHTCSFIIYMSVFLISLATNILLVIDNGRLRNASRDWGMSDYSGTTFDVRVSYQSQNEYWSLNTSRKDLDAAWDAIDTDSMAVTLHDRYAKDLGLEPSMRFPWDTERGVYYVKGIHDLHCLKVIRKALVSNHFKENHNFSFDHLLHCLDGLRQDVLCIADDTPMPAESAYHVGSGQVRRCRDWNKLKEWASESEQNACHRFDDYREATERVELFAYCPPDSPYLPAMRTYFDLHGHRDAYGGNIQ